MKNGKYRGYYCGNTFSTISVYDDGTWQWKLDNGISYWSGTEYLYGAAYSCRHNADKTDDAGFTYFKDNETKNWQFIIKNLDETNETVTVSIRYCEIIKAVTR